MVSQQDVRQVLKRIIRRDDPRTEADVQSDVRSLLLSGDLGLDDPHVSLEAPVSGRRRIDVEVGSAVIEVKKDLRAGNVLEDAEDQLAGYLGARQASHGSRYVGMLTDGKEWRDYHLDPAGKLVAVSMHTVPGEDGANELLVWLEGILATGQKIVPTPTEIVRRLGAGSSASQLDLSDLAAIYRQYAGEPSVAIKRELWARLLTVAFGTAFDDGDDDLFVSHTYLTIAAEMIAHSVLGYDLGAESHNPDALLLGSHFQAAGIGGVVESDFFDWVLEVPEGRKWVSGLARRLGRFDWSDVKHDILKILYETVIDPRTRHGLGEYYTPDWLADRVISEVFTDPAQQRLADVSCGSGTFLFHAVRAAVAACDSAGLSNAAVISSVTSRVYGIDVHPVAVTLARVTYLLALGTQRLTGERESFSVPVYLGDAVRFQEQYNILDGEGLTVYTTDGATLFETDLRFPERVIGDENHFDALVSEMANRAVERKTGTTPPSILEVYKRHGVHPEDRGVLDQTFAMLCQLHDEGRNHIWGYYVRNAARPGWFARESNRMDVLVGNPPWLAYNYMPSAMQKDFRRLAEERGLWPDANVVTKQDLAGLFVARGVEQYLKKGGVFGFIMPESALTRTTYAPFRKGSWRATSEVTTVEFDTPWDLSGLRPHPFPVPASVVFGRRTEKLYKRLEGDVVRFDGRPPDAIQTSSATIVTVPEKLEDWSPYRASFTQGAILSPRVLLMVEQEEAGPLGIPAGQVRVRSSRSTLEKKPWKEVPTLEGQIEKQFLLPLYSGNSLLPHLLLDPELAAVPWDGKALLDLDNPKLDQWPGFAAWWREACRVWNHHRSDRTKLSLAEQLDYRGKFRVQVGLQGVRVFYTTSGNHLAAAWTDAANTVVNNRLYWAVVPSKDEARYLTAVLNAPTTTELVAPLMGKGSFGERDFHLLPWALPIPTYNPASELHAQLIGLAEAAEVVAAKCDVDGTPFQQARGVVREALKEAGISYKADSAVKSLLK